MILRLAFNGAVHTAGGVAFGVTTALAAYTVAHFARRCAGRLRHGDHADHAPPPAQPSAPPPPPQATPPL